MLLVIHFPWLINSLTMMSSNEVKKLMARFFQMFISKARSHKCRLEQWTQCKVTLQLFIFFQRTE